MPDKKIEMKLKWNSPFIEIEENASGYFWRLRDRDHKSLAVAPRDYATLKELKEYLEKVAPILEQALKVNPLYSRLLNKEGLKI